MEEEARKKAMEGQSSKDVWTYEVVLQGWSKTSPSSCLLLLNNFWCMTCFKYVFNLCEQLNLICIMHECHTRFLCQNQVLIVCMTHDQLFHTLGPKVFIDNQMSRIKYNYYINNVSKD
jgi:hypothetical protein